MFAQFLKRLTEPQVDPLSKDDARLALAALLVRVARTDGTYDASEQSRIHLILQARYGLNSVDTQALHQQAETLETEAPDTVRFTRAIKDAVPYEDRLSVVEALWQVVLADGVREAEEDALLRMVTNFLGVSDRDSALARQRVTKS